MVKYGEKEIPYIFEKSDIMRGLTEKYGYLEKGETTDIFSSIIFHIISQMFSISAAKTIIGRFISLIGEVTPENILKIDSQKYVNVEYQKTK